jgi:exosortase D (VPLPA-CTERM-specific)
MTTALAIGRPLPRPWNLVAIVAVVGALAFAFRDGVSVMAAWWEEPEYSHGWLVPFIALYLVSIRADLLRAVATGNSWAGVFLLGAGLLLFVFGELSALYVLVQYAFVVTLWGLTMVLVGPGGARALWPALVMLLFMVPLPRFIQWNLSNELQLISSEIGARLLRAMGFAVYLEGNVIDLGVFKMQVVEACSGLRYLFPLMCFGLLCAVLYLGPAWQRWLVFLSSVPISILMNSFRIAMTGVLVNRFGTEAAEGFLHYFEGWVIFAGCLLIMFGEIWLLARLAQRPLDEVFDVQLPQTGSLAAIGRDLRQGVPLLAALVLSVGALGASLTLADRDELVPSHRPLSTFPLALGQWQGEEQQVPAEQLEELKLSDHVMAQYARPGDTQPVGLYVAWYESQRKGASIHSPKACLPGGGWQIEDFSQVQVPGAAAAGDLSVNRAVIALGDQRMLVYYWFMQRDRTLTNEYLVKWYIFWDSLTRKRTDGALVRIVSPVGDASQIAVADQRIADFIRDANPRIYYHIPTSGLAPG